MPNLKNIQGIQVDGETIMRRCEVCRKDTDQFMIKWTKKYWWVCYQCGNLFDAYIYFLERRARERQLYCGHKASKFNR